MSKLKIIAYGDIQIETDLNFTEHYRKNEYDMAFRHIEGVIEAEKPDFVTILGDIFQRWNPTGEEQSIFSEHLARLGDIGCKVLIMDGNHDVKRNDTMLLLDTGARHQMRTVVEALCRAANNPNITYLKNSGFYTTDRVTFAVWSHNDKHTCYSPFEAMAEDEGNTMNTINLYHDPYTGCKEYGEKGVRFEAKPDFKGFHVLAGDIHLPQVIKIDDTSNLSYTSSMVIRNFGEGDYWQNGKLVQRGNDKHGYRIVEYEDMKEVRNEFFAIPSYTGYHTIDIEDIRKEDIHSLSIIPAYGSNLVKVNIHNNKNGLYQCEHDIISHFKANYNNVVCRVHLNKDTDKLMVQNVSDTGVSQIVTKEGLKASAIEYIDQVVGSNKTLTDKQKAEVIDILRRVSMPNIDRLSMMSQRTDVKPLHGKLTNFMCYGSDVEFDFEEGIVRIGGSNGFGKTTIFRFISWMWLDIISSDLNANKTKENYQYLFNRHSRIDHVYGEITQMVDGREVLITKRVERIWKPTSSKVEKRWLKTDWVKLVDKFVVRYELWIDGVLMFDDAEAVRREVAKFVDETMFNTLVCTTQDNIDKLLGMDTNTLNNMIMRLAGVDVFEGMADSVEEVKREEMAKYRNTGRTVGEISLQINATKDSIKKHDEAIIQLDAAIAAKESEKAVIEAQREDINSKINYTLRPGVLIDLDITNNMQDRQKCDKDLSAVGVYKKDIEGRLAAIEAEYTDIDTTMTLKEAERKSCIVEQDKAKLSLGFETSALQSLKERSKSVIEGLKASMAGQVSERRLQVSQKNNSLTQANGKLKDIATFLRTHLDGITQEYNIAKSEQEALLSTYANGLKMVEYMNDTYTKDLSRLDRDIDEKTKEKAATILEIEKADNYCPQCNAVLDPSRIDRMKAKVKSLEEAIGNGNIQKNEVFTNQKNNQTERSGYEANILNTKASLESLKARYVEDSKAENLPKDKMDELNETQECIKKLTQEIAQANAEITQFIEGIDTKVLTDGSYIQTIADIKAKEKDIEVLEGQISTLTVSIYDLTISIEKLQKVIDEKRTITENIAKLDAGTLQLEAKVLDLINASSALEKEKAQSITNEELKKQHTALAMAFNDLSTEYINLKSSLSVTERERTLAIERLAELDSDLTDTMSYDSATSAMKIYTTMVGKKGLPAFIFGKVAAILNGHFNTLLKDMYFRIRFNEDNVLLFVNYKDMENPFEVPCNIISGMEKTFAGLALKDALNTVNICKKYGIMLIDEITGKLNNGENVSYNTVDYMEEMVKVLHKIQKNSQTCMMLVDHHIKELGENVILETGADEKGFSKITKRKVY